VQLQTVMYFTLLFLFYSCYH